MFLGLGHEIIESILLGSARTCPIEIKCLKYSLYGCLCEETLREFDIELVCGKASKDMAKVIEVIGKGGTVN